jgi:hypothetical protein
MSDLVICKEICRVKNGYILQLRWPYGDEPMGYGTVIADDWPAVLRLLTHASDLRPEQEWEALTAAASKQDP